MLMLFTFILFLNTKATAMVGTSAPLVVKPMKNVSPILEARKGRERMYYKYHRPYKGYTYEYSYPYQRYYYHPNYPYRYRYNTPYVYQYSYPYTYSHPYPPRHYYYQRREHYRTYDPLSSLIIELFD